MTRWWSATPEGRLTWRRRVVVRTREPCRSDDSLYPVLSSLGTQGCDLSDWRRGPWSDTGVSDTRCSGQKMGIRVWESTYGDGKIPFFLDQWDDRRKKRCLKEKRDEMPGSCWHCWQAYGPLLQQGLPCCILNKSCHVTFWNISATTQTYKCLFGIVCLCQG